MKPLAWLCVLASLALPARAGDFSNWAAIVVAGDFHAETGEPSEVFDNGRATIARQLVDLGFSPANIAQFSVRPERYPSDHARPSTLPNIADGLRDAAGRAPGGCFAYFTSHGSDDGIQMGEGEITPRQMAKLIDQACTGRPAVVVVSACYSGVFVRRLKGPDRIVLTAAAADRPSFGCGATDRYTYFDACAVEWLPKAGDFVAFANRTIDCVRSREKTEKVEIASHPQLAVGRNAELFPRWSAKPD